MAKEEWGEKRVCQSCSKNFYDMLRLPIACPECETVFVVPEPVLRRVPLRAGRKVLSAKRAAAAEVAFEPWVVTEGTADGEDGEREGDEDGEGDAVEIDEDGNPDSVEGGSDPRVEDVAA